MSKVMLYARFERLWHWSQAILIIIMLVTGFNIHGSISLLTFEQAVDIHTFAAWLLIGIWIFAWFWHITTGEWKQYIPSVPERVFAMARYYSVGIFQGKPHPFHKDRRHKHNPLQRMAYLALHVVIAPAVWISGLLYLFYSDWDAIGLSVLPLGAVAMIHTAAAFLMLTFLIAHLYLAVTMSDTFGANVKAMITGYEDLEESETS